MAYGARYSYPRRYGGGKSTQQAIYESLNISLGTAFDTSDGSTVTAETSADARAFAAVGSPDPPRCGRSSVGPRRCGGPTRAGSAGGFGERFGAAFVQAQT